MMKNLGGEYRNIRIINGKASILIKAIVPMPKDMKKAEKVCELNRWSMKPDHFGNLSVTTTVTFDVNSLNDRTLMNAFIGFAEKAAAALVGNKSLYLMACVASYNAVAV